MLLKQRAGRTLVGGIIAAFDLAQSEIGAFMLADDHDRARRVIGHNRLPTFDPVEARRATAIGWHRSFCIELTNWRGTPEQPGLMMALDRGGRCSGMAFRLLDDNRLAELKRMVRREILAREDVGMVRWIKLQTEAGRLRALVFWAGPKGDGISLKLPLDKVAFVLARACGHGGSCAEYLYNTVSHLEALGIRDPNLWRLQQLVAEEIARIYKIPTPIVSRGISA
ncbi:gamma-glutamylcyclotransferase [Nordella sp. HKS 07]|nr:gamma-glutamylcyclotransferase [Nordella sp. HKS 07]